MHTFLSRPFLTAWTEALRAAGVSEELPSPLANLLAADSEIESRLKGPDWSPDHVGRDAIAAIENGSDPATALSEAAATLWKSEAITQLVQQGRMRDMIARRVKAEMIAAQPAMAKKIGPALKKTMAALVDAAGRLPASLDSESIIEADAGAAYTGARDAADRLMVLGQILAPIAGHKPQGFAHLVTFPDVPLRNPDKESYEDHEKRDRGNVLHVAEELRTAPARGLILAASGRFPGIAVDPVCDPPEIERRNTAVDRAGKRLAKSMVAMGL